MESVNLRKQTLAAGLILLLALPALAQQGTVTAPAKQQKQETRATQDGIKVHGHWTIVVRNPDGSIASRHEFENSLAGGDEVLAGVLGHTMTAGLWSVILRDPCTVHVNGSHPGACVLQEANPHPLANMGAEPVLTLKLSGTPKLNALILSGSVKSHDGGTIFRVATRASTCPATTLPADCEPTNTTQFTSQDITPITVQPGQSIDVTVQLSFS